jgi:hypothetical protein
MSIFDRPRLFLWEIGSYADELKLGYVDDKPFEPGIWKQGEPESKWMSWTAFDRLGAMPEEVAPERFYLWSPLRSRNGVGDFSGTSERVVKIASKRFVDALTDMGQEHLRVFPLTFWRRSEGGVAPAPEPDEPLRAIHCWAKVDIFDLGRSVVNRLNPWHYTRLTGNQYDDGNPEPLIFISWTKLVLRDGLSASTITFPPLFGIKGLQKRLFVSPQLAEFIQRKKFKVKLIEREIDLEHGRALGEAHRSGRLNAWPERTPLGT